MYEIETTRTFCFADGVSLHWHEQTEKKEQSQIHNYANNGSDDPVQCPFLTGVICTVNPFIKTKHQDSLTNNEAEVSPRRSRVIASTKYLNRTIYGRNDRSHCECLNQQAFRGSIHAHVRDDSLEGQVMQDENEYEHCHSSLAEHQHEPHEEPVVRTPH